MKRLVFPIVTLSLFILTACGGFDSEAAERESGEALASFLDSHDHGEVLLETYDAESTKEVVKEQYGEFFTSDFQEIVEDKIQDTSDDLNGSGGSFSSNPETFFLLGNHLKELVALSAYDVVASEVNEESETVLHTLRFQDGESPIGRITTQLEMANDDGEWKISEAK